MRFVAAINTRIYGRYYAQGSDIDITGWSRKQMLQFLNLGLMQASSISAGVIQDAISFEGAGVTVDTDADGKLIVTITETEHEIDWLLDVDTSGRTDGQLLSWNEAEALWKPVTLVVDDAVLELADLTDVETAGAMDAWVLEYDLTAGIWAAVAPHHTLATLNDVDVAGIIDGQTVVWDQSAAEFVPGTPAGAPGPPGPASWATPVPWVPGLVATVGPPTTVVTYLGSTYLCIANNTSIAPTNTGFWRLIASKGDIGATGPASTIPGPQGEPGEKGDTGDTGPEGPSGESAGKTFYLATSDASEIATYKTMLESPSTGSEQNVLVACTGTADTLVGIFATEPNVPGVVDFPAGTVFRRFWAFCSSGSFRFHLLVYRRSVAGTETLVRDELSPTFTNMSAAMCQWIVTQPGAGALDPTDRIVTKVYAQRVSGATSINVTTYFEGTARASHIQTTISAGAQGPAGPGVPTGGATGQVLTKDSASDYDTSWQDSAGGGGGAGWTNQGEYDGGTTYNEGDVVTYGTGVYVALVDDPETAPGAPPSTFTDSFDVAMDPLSGDWTTTYTVGTSTSPANIRWRTDGLGTARSDPNNTTSTSRALIDGGNVNGTVRMLGASRFNNLAVRGVLLRHVDTNNCIMVYEASSTTTVVAQSVVSGSATTLGSWTTPGDYAFDIEVTVDGTDLDINWGGVLNSYTVPAPAGTETQVGMFSQGGGGNTSTEAVIITGFEWDPADIVGWLRLEDEYAELVHTHDYAPVTHTHTASQVSDSTTVGRAVLTAASTAAARTAIAVLDSFVFSDTRTTLTAAAGTMKLPNATGRTLTITGVRLDVVTAPTGAALVVDVHKNGTTVFTTQANRPQVAASAVSGVSGAVSVPAWAAGETLTIDIDQIGSTVPGGQMTVTITAEG